MKVSVIGGGAIGLLVSFFIRKKGIDCVVYTRTEEQAKQLKQEGITCISATGKKETVQVDAFPIGCFTGDEEFCVIAVKQTSINDLQFLNDEKTKKVSLLFLQNGVSHIPFIESLPQKNIILGVVEHGALKDGFSSVHHLGAGRIKAAAFKGSGLENWLSLFPAEHFPIYIERDWQSMLYVKLVMNAAINPVTALLRIQNGKLLENTYAFQLMSKLFDETIEVLDLRSRKQELWKELLMLCRNTSLNKSSMLKSVESGQQTEIEAITGEVLKRAKTKNIAAPYSETVYFGVKAMDWRG